MYSENTDLNSLAPALSGNLELSEKESALAAAVLEVSRLEAEEAASSAVTSSKLPGAANTELRRFALFFTAELLKQSPEFATLLGAEAVSQAKKDALHLSSFELPVEEAEISAELEQAMWPQDVAGGLVCGEVLTQAGQRKIYAGVLLSGEVISAVVDPEKTSKLQIGKAVLPEITDLLQASLGI